MVFNIITPCRPCFSLNKSVGWEDPGKRLTKMFYEKTLVRLGLPSGLENEEGFVLQKGGQNMEEKCLRKHPGWPVLKLAQLTRATTLLWNGTGLGWMFV